MKKIKLIKSILKDIFCNGIALNIYIILCFAVLCLVIYQSVNLIQFLYF